jgi:hypothetical protein
VKILGLFGNILYEFVYPEPEPKRGQKTSAPAPAKSCGSTGSGSATLAIAVNRIFFVLKQSENSFGKKEPVVRNLIVSVRLQLKINFVVYPHKYI